MTTRQSLPDSNEHVICFGTVYAIDEATGGLLLPLGGKKYSGMFAIVDADDILRVARHTWSAYRPQSRGDRCTLYVRASINYKQVHLHRFVMGITDPRVTVDHINHNPLDNRKSNLRLATMQEQMFNRRPNLRGTSPYKGVSWSKAMKRWHVAIKRGGVFMSIGYFADEEEAARAYDEAARVLFGERAYLNFPPEAAS